LADIHIVREHALGLEQARKLALRWAEVAEKKLAMHCTYEEGETSDLVSFKRSGANGELKVSSDRFELDARLGLLLGVFRARIEGEIAKNLDQLLAQKDPVQAFEDGLAQHEHKREAKQAKAHAQPRKAAAKPAASAAKQPPGKPGKG
jgi:putative polyhydroxyalkanoate system protein